MSSSQEFKELYFMETKQYGSSYIKIGISNNVERRRLQIEDQIKGRAQVIAIFGFNSYDGASDLEYRLHRLLSKYRQNNLGWGREWFSANEALTVLYWLKTVTSNYIIYKPIYPIENTSLWFSFCVALAHKDNFNVPDLPKIDIYKKFNIYGEVIYCHPDFMVIENSRGDDIFVKYNFPRGLEYDYFFKSRGARVKGIGIEKGQHIFIAGNPNISTDHIWGMALNEKISQLQNIPHEYYERVGSQEFSNPIYAKIDELYSFYDANNS